ncbi:MAG: 16S rRNA (guanine(527)-N(7))-methyltransferase RsmG [bacterium]
MEINDLNQEEYLYHQAQSIGIELSEIKIKQFIIYLKELKEWNSKINLTRIIDDKEIIDRHFIESLMYALFFKFKEGIEVVDIGSGAGFPGLPLKIDKPGIRLTIVERNKKKQAFINNVVRKIGSKLEGMFADITEPSKKYDVIVIRGVDINESLIKKIANITKDNGILTLKSSSKLEENLNILIKYNFFERKDFKVNSQTKPLDRKKIDYTKEENCIRMFLFHMKQKKEKGE